MADDKLRIVATVEDQFTGPLSKLEKGLKHVGEETAKQGATWKKDWEGVRGEVSKFQGVLRGFDPILSAVGVGSFGAAMSIAGMVTAVKNFSGQTRDLSQMGRQIGMTVDQLRTLGALGEKFGVSADAMRGAIGQFATNMVDLRQRWGQVYGELRNMNLGHLAEELVNAPSMEAAVEAAMKALQNIPDSMKAARVSTLIFGTPDMATISRSITGKISDALKQTQADIGHLDKETEEAARRFEEHFSRIGRAAEKAKLKVLGPVLRNVAGALDQMDAAASDPEGEQIKRLKESRQSADNAVKAAPYGTGWYFERQRDTLDQEIKRLEARRANPAATVTEDKLGSAKAELDYYQNRRLTKDPGREKELAEEIKRLTEELRRLRESGAGTATVQQQSFNGGGSLGGGSLIQKAAWGGFGSPGAGASIPAYGSPGGGSGGGSSGGGFGSSGGPGAPSGPDLGDGIRGRPFGSKGDGTLPPANYRGANPGAYKAVLDHIAKAEGTANQPGGGYNTSLGYGRYLPGGKEQNLTGMTLDQISALGRYMRRQPGNPNSSALGRYQIVGDTMRRLMKRMGLKGGELFDERMQDRMAAELARDTRGNPARLRREWSSLVGERNRRAAELMGQVDPSASTMPEDAPASTAKGPLSDPAGPLSEPKAETHEEGAPEPTDGRGVNADLIKVLKRAQQLSKVKFHIHEGLRTLGRQREMVRRGWSKTLDSEHLKGRAVDVRADGDPAVGDLDRRKYEEINRAMRQASEEAGIPIEWGGDWKKFKDIPHFQFPKAYKARAEAYAGDGTRAAKAAPEPRPSPGSDRPEDQPVEHQPTDYERWQAQRSAKRKVGDALMDRMYGKGAIGGGPAMQMPGGSGAGGKGSLHIKVDGPPGTQVKADMSDLFGDTTVSHGKSQMSMAQA